MSLPQGVARCPAKVNLSLRVLGRRPDGYHELDTVFQAIDLWDRLEVRAAERLELSCDDPSVPRDGRNLVLQAASRLHEFAAGGPRGASFRLLKAIPAQGGLGGGSSDAAGALLLCRNLWSVDVEDGALAAIGADLGADVPFFLLGGTARGRGRGDRLEALPTIGNVSLILGLPPFGVSTAEVFSAYASCLTLPPNTVSLPAVPGLKLWEENDFPAPVNDLERVVFRRWPELERFRDALLAAGARSALLSGSGSTVYGVFDDAAVLARAADGLRRSFDSWRVLRTRAVDRGAHVVEPA